MNLLFAWLLWLIRLFQRSIQPGDEILLRSPDSPQRSGTLGCVVVIDRRRYALTCNHVLEGGSAGSKVAQYIPPKGPVPAEDRLSGRYGRTIGELWGRSEQTDSVDCSLVKIWFHARVKSRHPHPVGWVAPEVYPVDGLVITKPVDLTGRIPVQFCGASTKPANKGAASLGAWAPLTLNSRSGEVTIEPPYLEIKSEMASAIDFCTGGDSGSLVVTAFAGQRPRPIGLLVGARGDGIADFGLAVPFQRVLDAIGSGARLDSR